MVEKSRPVLLLAEGRAEKVRENVMFSARMGQ